MAEYIEREAVLTEINSVIKDYADEHTFATDFAAAVVCELRDNVVATVPAADVVKRERGEWNIILSDYDDCELMVCSCCRSEFYDGDNDTVDHLFNFCPHCGADMRPEGGAEG